jgi:hypothetical protein
MDGGGYRTCRLSADRVAAPASPSGFSVDMVAPMRTRLNMIIVAFLAILVVMMLVVIRDGGPRPRQAAPHLAAVEVMQPVAEPAPAPSPAPLAAAAPEVAVVAPPAADDDKSKYTAQWGDTVSNLAAELPGGNLKVNRAAVINANPALQADPDRLIAGQTYEIPANAAAPAPVAAPVVPVPVPAAAEATTAAPAPAEAPDAGTHQLRYTARAGDNVSVLAAALLGDDSKANRDAIVAANHSLQVNPDRVVDGRTYRIPVGQTQPLSAAAPDATNAAAQPAAAKVGAEPDADDVVEASAARDLRYTAQPGDTVSTLAVALLGSDTPANRAAIIDNNKSLVKDADHVVAGQTYWITAPTTATR